MCVCVCVSVCVCMCELHYIVPINSGQGWPVCGVSHGNCTPWASPLLGPPGTKKLFRLNGLYGAVTSLYSTKRHNPEEMSSFQVIVDV